MSVPTGERSAIGHLQALCAAVGAVSGMAIELNPGASNEWFDQQFAVGAKPFAWGPSGTVAREALDQLVTLSATTLC